MRKKKLSLLTILSFSVLASCANYHPDNNDARPVQYHYHQGGLSGGYGGLGGGFSGAQ
ncbi:hypothetical protein [Kozakia baliensis]|uniref:hypothetical protein n=1 Tax=Kozakia baliensis TaxID=153496 RepID=UPI000ABEE456|nr:hypothetical protein [Kozakia baliensis]